VGVLLLATSALSAGGQEIGVEADDLFIVPEGRQGCWVSFFENRDFRPPAVQLTGRTFVESFEPNAQAVVEPPLQKAGGAEFLQRVQSIVVGPHARLVGFAEAQYSGGRTLELGPGRRVPDVSRLDFHQRVDSLKVFCHGD
jgi:hypothetical protein